MKSEVSCIKNACIHSFQLQATKLLRDLIKMANIFLPENAFQNILLYFASTLIETVKKVGIFHFIKFVLAIVFVSGVIGNA